MMNIGNLEIALELFRQGNEYLDNIALEKINELEESAFKSVRINTSLIASAMGILKKEMQISTGLDKRKNESVRDIRKRYFDGDNIQMWIAFRKQGLREQALTETIIQILKEKESWIRRCIRKLKWLFRS